MGMAILRDEEVILYFITKIIQLKTHIYDITICLRFYVIKGELRLKKGDKTNLLGFYCNNSNDSILIKCRKNHQ